MHAANLEHKEVNFGFCLGQEKRIQLQMHTCRRMKELFSWETDAAKSAPTRH